VAQLTDPATDTKQRKGHEEKYLVPWSGRVADWDML